LEEEFYSHFNRDCVTVKFKPKGVRWIEIQKTRWIMTMAIAKVKIT